MQVEVELDLLDLLQKAITAYCGQKAGQMLAMARHLCLLHAPYHAAHTPSFYCVSAMCVRAVVMAAVGGWLDQAAWRF